MVFHLYCTCSPSLPSLSGNSKNSGIHTRQMWRWTCCKNLTGEQVSSYILKINSSCFLKNIILCTVEVVFNIRSQTWPQKYQKILIFYKGKSYLNILSSQKRGGSRGLPNDLSCLPIQSAIFFFITTRDILMLKIWKNWFQSLGPNKCGVFFYVESATTNSEEH